MGIEGLRIEPWGSLTLEKSKGVCARGRRDKRGKEQSSWDSSEKEWPVCQILQDESVA